MVVVKVAVGLKSYPETSSHQPELTHVSSCFTEQDDFLQFLKCSVMLTFVLITMDRGEKWTLHNYFSLLTRDSGRHYTQYIY